MSSTYIPEEHIAVVLGLAFWEDGQTGNCDCWDKVYSSHIKQIMSSAGGEEGNAGSMLHVCFSFFFFLWLPLFVN